jgi:hypothetical protein
MNCKFAINYQVNCRPYIIVEVQKNTQLTKINHNQVDKWTIVDNHNQVDKWTPI